VPPPRRTATGAWLVQLPASTIATDTFATSAPP
jgi:hypothetical protein